MLPIEEDCMPDDDVSDLRDVVDAINKLCDTMKTSYDEPHEANADLFVTVDEGLVDPTEIVVRKVEILVAERWCDPAPEYEDATSDPEPMAEVPCEPISEIYYTASDVSLLSETELQDKTREDSDKERDDRDRVMAGHVAAMRERFESMTRTNTPCPDLIRSTSPSFEVFRNTSASPDHLDKS